MAKLNKLPHMKCARLCTGCGDSIVELKKSGTPQRRMTLPDDVWSSSLSSFVIIPEVTLQSSDNRQIRSHLLV